MSGLARLLWGRRGARAHGGTLSRAADDRSAPTSVGALARVMAGEGRPSTISNAARSRGWPAFAGHDTGERVLAVRDIAPRATRTHARLDTGGRTAATTVRAAQRLNQGSALLAFSVLLDSAVEHYRGSFRNPAMVTPLVVSALTLGLSAHGTRDRTPAAHRVRHGVAATAAATGLIGTGFHVWNVAKRPGRFAWQNLFYGAPLGAPFAILLAGLLGTAAERVRDTPPSQPPRLLGFRAGRFLTVLSGLGLLGTTGEAGLLHFRGAFHNPAMFIPVTLPPIGAALLLGTAASEGRTPVSAPVAGRGQRERVGRTGRGASRRSAHPSPLPHGESGRPSLHRATRWWMRGLAVMGFVGVGFHAYGVQRNMGGWRNWSQNVLNGPPLPAPPSFTGLALAGLAALGLLEEHPDA